MNSPSKERGTVFLVGAGPGHPDLLTVRAMHLISTTPVVAYDSLIPQKILDLIPLSTEALAVGRRYGSGDSGHRIHPSVLARAHAGIDVVRLKSGDPLIFGRGGEEIDALEQHALPYEIIPGVCSAMGAAASARIPLTHRDYSARVYFATGHRADTRPLVTHPGPDHADTIVLFMATHQARANVEGLISSGWPADTPASCIACAWRHDEIIVPASLETLADTLERSDIPLPALIIVGRVVDLAAIHPSTLSR